MKFFVAVLAVSALALTSGAPTEMSWNALTKAVNLFPAEYDSVLPSKSADTFAVLEQLDAMLKDPAILSQVYSNYLEIHGKSGRQQPNIFAANVYAIAEHNLQFAAGLHTWDQAVNKFTDMTEEELSRFTGDVILDNSTIPFASIEDIRMDKSYKAAPASLDWRTSGIVTEVKNQEDCGACWSFSACSIVESSTAKATKKMLNLSEQELVDCDKNSGGCGGGNVYWAFKYMKENGVVAESSYPYKKKQGSCIRCQKGSSVATVKEFKRIDGESSFPDAMATYGPMGVSLLVDGNGWYKYSSGVYSGPCGNGGHAVNIVGYGTDNGTPFWIIKNSWGPNWGMKGYMHFPRGQDKCTIATRNGAYYVTV